MRTRTLLRSLVIGVIVASVGMASAAQRTTVCARQGSGWGGKAYQVQATLATGQELVQATHSFAYDVFSSYVVIFWAEHQASVIKLDFPTLTVVGVDGTDQEGRRWNVSTNPICF